MVRAVAVEGAGAGTGVLGWGRPCAGGQEGGRSGNVGAQAVRSTQWRLGTGSKGSMLTEQRGYACVGSRYAGMRGVAYRPAPHVVTRR